MSNFAYTSVPGKLKDIFQKIREVGVPPKATIEWLNSVGFRSSNDRTLITVLKFIGFLDNSGVPTERWKQYRGSNHRQVLAKAIKEAYSELYSLYPDAHNRSTNELEHFFKTKSTAGQQVIAKTVNTFQNLCKLADFSEIDVHKLPEIEPKESEVHEKKSESTRGISNLVPSIHIDIQIHISPEASTEQIDKIFQSMAKYIFKYKEK